MGGSEGLIGDSPPAIRPAREGGPSRIVHTVWSGSCLLALILLIGIRWLRYTSWSASSRLDGVLRELMVIDVQAFLWPWAYSTLELRIGLVALAVLVVSLHRRLLPRLVRRVDGVWRLRPVAVSILATVMLWLHYAFDLNPTVALACATSLVLAWLTEQPRLARKLPTGVLAAMWGALLLYWIIEAHDLTDRLAIVVWAIALSSTRYLAPRLGRSELTLLRVVAVMPVNLLPATLPLFVPLHGGTQLGDGLAYAFCEVPNRQRLYASVPECDSVRANYEDCRGGRIVEYDLASMKPLAAHRFFSPGFYGRLELLVCLDDEVQVAVQACVYHGRNIKMSALSFPVAAPGNFEPVVAGEGLGMTIAYDRKHDSLFYSGEFTNRVVRYDRRTRTFDATAAQDFAHRWYQPVSLEGHDGSIMLHTSSIHPGRNRIYLADWMQGRYAYAVDLTTLHAVTRYDVGGGGALGVAVDPGRDRLFVSSVWGLEVFDLATDTLVTRKRTGLGNRPVIVDTARNRLYVSSMVEGKIRVLDRDTLEVIGQIPVGIGSRYPHLSLDGRYLFASSTLAHYYWDADTLARSR